MMSIDHALGACDFIHVSEPDHGRHHVHRDIRVILRRQSHRCVPAWGFHRRPALMQRGAVMASAISATWLAVFLYRFRNPAPENRILANAIEMTGSVRPFVAILFAIAAILVGSLYSPTAAVLIFKMILGYDAWLDRDIQRGEVTTRTVRA